MFVDSRESQLHVKTAAASLGLERQGVGTQLAKSHKRGLRRFLMVRRILVEMKRRLFTWGFGMDIDKTAEFSLSARLDLTFPIGVHLGRNSYVAFDAVVLTHDRTRGLYLHTWVGEKCFIGARSILMPGISVGEGSIVGAGSVVTKDVPPYSMVVGNPARVVASNIDVRDYGRLASADAQESALASHGLT